jgi:hypothetical protein
MPDTAEEQNFQSELRQAQMAAKNEPDGGGQTEEESEEEAPEEEPETLETPGEERAARSSLLGKHAKVAAEKAAGQSIKLAGRAGQAVSFVLQRVGTTLLSFGLGLGLTIIGILIGLPLLLIGAGLTIGGLLISVTARLTIAAGETAVQRAKKEEKKLAKEAGGAKSGGLVNAAEEAGEMARTMKKYAGVIAAPFIYIGCTIIGLFSGFIFIAIIVATLFS